MSNMETSSANTPAQSEASIQDVSQQPAGNIGPSSVSQPSTHQGKIYVCLIYRFQDIELSFSLFLFLSLSFCPPFLSHLSSSPRFLSPRVSGHSDYLPLPSTVMYRTGKDEQLMRKRDTNVCNYYSLFFVLHVSIFDC